MENKTVKGTVKICYFALCKFFVYFFSRIKDKFHSKMSTKQSKRKANATPPLYSSSLYFLIPFNCVRHSFSILLFDCHLNFVLITFFFFFYLLWGAFIELCWKCENCFDSNKNGWKKVMTKMRMHNERVCPAQIFQIVLFFFHFDKLLNYVKTFMIWDGFHSKSFVRTVKIREKINGKMILS